MGIGIVMSSEEQELSLILSESVGVRSPTITDCQLIDYIGKDTPRNVTSLNMDKLVLTQEQEPIKKDLLNRLKLIPPGVPVSIKSLGLDKEQLGELFKHLTITGSTSPNSSVVEQPKLEFFYTNYKGNEEKRIVSTKVHIWHGVSKYHKDKQHFLRAYDYDREGIRDFAMSDISCFLQVSGC